MKLAPRMTQAETDAGPLAALTEEAAAQAMCLFDCDHKLQLILNIREYHAGMLAQVRAGVTVEDVRAPFFKAAEPAKRMRRVA